MKKSEKTKAALADALEELLTEQPLSKIRVRNITDRVGVDRQTFYYHFDTLSDLALFLYHSRIDYLIDALPCCNDAYEMFSKMADSIAAHKGMLRGLLEAIGRPALRVILQDDAKMVLRAQAQHICTERGVYLLESELNFAVSYCLLASASMLVDWLEADDDVSAQKLASDLARAFEQHINGVLYDK